MTLALIKIVCTIFLDIHIGPIGQIPVKVKVTDANKTRFNTPSFVLWNWLGDNDEMQWCFYVVFKDHSGHRLCANA